MKTILILNLMLLSVFVFGWETETTEPTPEGTQKLVSLEKTDTEKTVSDEKTDTEKGDNAVSPIQEKKTEKKKKKKKKGYKKLPTWLKEDGRYKDKLMFWGGMGSHLFGYTDERYASDDKGAYLKSKSFNIGLEYYKEGFGGSLKDIRFGVNIAFQNRAAFGENTLAAMLHVAEKTIPSDQKNINAESWLNLGFFGGIDNKWYGIDLGLTISLNPYYEKEIEMIDGTKEEGRGWLWGSGTTIYPNFHLRLGQEESAHFVFNVLREDYDVKYGVINVYVSLPMNKYFGLDIGGYLYQTDSIFIAPRVNIGAFTAKFKFGTIVNYQEEVFTKVSIFDSLFGNLALSYEW